MSTVIPTAPTLIIVSGLSGSGKSVALKTFEDQDYYCSDNIPVDLLPEFVRGVLGGLFGGNSGANTTTATSTVGIRGLDAEDIAKAQPNPAAVGRVEGMRVNADQARQFASSASLQARDVPAMAQPAAGKA